MKLSYQIDSMNASADFSQLQNQTKSNYYATNFTLKSSNMQKSKNIFRKMNYTDANESSMKFIPVARQSLTGVGDRGS